MLPTCLNPRFVDLIKPEQLPLCWYGVALLPDNLLELTVECKLAVRECPDHPDSMWDWYRSFRNLRDEFERESGIRIDLQQVHGLGTLPFLSFWSNWEIKRVTMDMFPTHTNWCG